MRFYFLSFLLLNAFILKAQDNVNDSLLRIISSSVTDTIKLLAYSDLSWNYSKSDFILSEKYAKEELKLAEKIKNKKWIAQAYNDLGISFYQHGKSEQAFINYELSLKLRQEIGDSNLIASSLSKIGIIQYDMGQYSKALETQYKVLSYFEKLGQETKAAMTLNNIAQTFDKLKNYDKEIEYGEKAIALHLKNNNEYYLGQCYGNLGTAYKMKKNLDKSDEYLKMARDIFHKYEDLVNEAAILNNMGLNAKASGDSSLALEYYYKAYNLASSIDDRAGMTLYGHNISCGLTDAGKYSEAEKYSLTVLKMTDSTNKPQLLLTYRQLATIYGYLNKGDKARVFLNKYADLKDSLFTKENAKQIAEMDVRYQTEKKDLELAKNKAELEAKDRQNFIKNIIIVSILIIAILFSLLLFSFYRRKQIKQKAETDAELSRQKELRSKAIIEAEEKERRRIAQDLHDGVGQILSAAKLNLSGLESKIELQSKEERDLLNNAISLVNDSVKEVRTVSHNMIPNTLIKLGLASAVREFISKLSSVPNLKIDLQIIGLDQRLDNSIETILYRVIQEIVSNIIKHAKANHISMQMIRHEQEFTIIIEDNGIGFDKAKEFEGIGLKNIISRIEFLNGHVEFDSTPGQGTTVIVEVPIISGN